MFLLFTSELTTGKFVFDLFIGNACQRSISIGEILTKFITVIECPSINRLCNGMYS